MELETTMEINEKINGNLKSESKSESKSEEKRGHEGQEDVLILAIESSCDETAASVVKNGRERCV